MQIDTFLLKKQKSLGKIKKVKIGHDNHGIGPGECFCSTFVCFAAGSAQVSVFCWSEAALPLCSFSCKPFTSYYSCCSPGWHLDHVDIFDDATGKRYFFPCQKWFDKDEEDGLLERVLEVSGAFRASA